MTGLYGKITIDSVNFSWGSTQALVEVIGGWDVLTWEERVKIRDVIRKRLKEERDKKKAEKKDGEKKSEFFS
ncbi:hypothetical protein DRH27_04225 [Candidatus Falkowbacteria bacterium]|nr:MAG: hypothetical protein DRH27_04225 [Candidatus Falkowbacteria bacterium]